MPPERPPASPDPDRDAEREQRLHDLFAGFRAWVRPVRPGRRSAVLDAIRAARSERRRGPPVGSLLGAGLVQVLNLLAAALGHGAPPPRPGGRASSSESDHDQP
ncbi:MAG: hypothetical protein D6798_13065 [Deltaproteobacteria bacterium]|nr:MAG: hypothetical protein D6798_13065 [Deltaproteobacteria bacterium]